jgi:glycosyltransferase involved in cell wall biosynthesis
VKIGIYDPYLDDLGGGEKYMMTIAECLSRDHDVTVFWDNKEDFETLKKRFLLNLENVTLTKNIFSRKTNILKRLLSTRKFDAVFFLSDGSIPLVASKKLFIHFQQPLQLLGSRSPKTKFKLSKVNAFFSNSKFTKSYIDKTFGISSKVIYPPVSLYPKKLKKENIILNVGRLRVKSVGTDEYKKQSTMIKAFKEMVNGGLKNWELVFAVSVKQEDEKYFGELEKKANGYPVEFIVNKNNRELWDIYNKAKIYWHASGFGEDLIRHPEYAEHFGISTVEAMGAGVVPVVISAGGQKEIVEDGKSGFLWNTIQDLVEYTKKLIEDQNLWAKMSEEANVRSKKFTGDRFCSEIRNLL